MSLKNSFIIGLARIVTATARLLHLGSGSTWPGHIALKLNPEFIKQVVTSSDLSVVLIAGTNGKTTTSSLLRFILEKNGKKVMQNKEGANLLNGIASTLIHHSRFLGKNPYKYAIFEIDENNLPLLLKQIHPKAIVLLNLFRDQLDRYGEVNTIARNWQNAIQHVPSGVQVVINGDDPQLAFIGSKTSAMVQYFGMAADQMQNRELGVDVDSIYCPNCGKKLAYKEIAYSHLGNFRCTNCHFHHPKTIVYDSKLLQSPLKGVYNFYNITAAVLTALTITDYKVNDIMPLLKEFPAVFGRQETIVFNNRTIFLLLSKNPTGFNQSIAVVKELIRKKKGSIMLILNDRIPDGRDVSWIWDVDFEQLLPVAQAIYITGDRAYDMALRMEYSLGDRPEVDSTQQAAFFASCHVIDDLKKALKVATTHTPEHEQLYILATYSGMLDARQLLVGRKLL